MNAVERNDRCISCCGLPRTTRAYPSEHVVAHVMCLVMVVRVSREVLCKILCTYDGIRTYVRSGMSGITVDGSSRFPVGPKSSFRSRSPKSNRNDRNSAEFRRKIQPRED